MWSEGHRMGRLRVQAEGLVLSLRDLFQVVFVMKKKQEAEANNSDASGVVDETDTKSESEETQVSEVSARDHWPSLDGC